MSRPPKQPKRNEVDPGELDDHDSVVRRRRGMSGEPEPAPDEHVDAGEFFGALLNSPPLCALAAKMGTFVRTAGDRADSFSHYDREFVDQVLSADWETNVVQAVHIPDALAVGIRIEAIEALRYGHEDELTDEERQLAGFIRGVVAGTLDDEQYEQMVARLGTRGTVEYVGFILWLQWIMRMMQALGTSDPADDEIDALIQSFKAGEREPEDFRQRIR